MGWAGFDDAARVSLFAKSVAGGASGINLGIERAIFCEGLTGLMSVNALELGEEP